MRALRIAGMAASVALAAGFGACSSGGKQAAQPAPVVAAKPYVPTPHDRARELVAAANLQLVDLEGIRAATGEPARKAAIDRQISSISLWRDALQADLPPGRAASPDDALVRRDSANLRRAMQAAAATAPQGPFPPPLAQPLPPLGDDAAGPPMR
jgi:hypothetical protein